MTADPPTVAAVLAAEAAANGLSDYALAERTGLSRSAVRRYLAADRSPDADALLRLLGALGRDLAWLHAEGVRPPAL